MIAATDDFSDKVPGPAQDAFTTAQAQRVTTPAPQQDERIPFDAAIGKQVAQQVMARGARSRLEGQGLVVDPAIVGTEPEEVGLKGSGLRRCIVTGEVLPREQMIRFVLSPDNVVTPDLEERLPGRGYWVVAHHAALHSAVENDVFARATHGAAVVPPALIDQVVMLARRACMSTLGLARRAWACDFGVEGVRQAIVTGKVGLILIATNAPQNTQQKLDYIKGDIPTLMLFSTAELSAALGRERLAFASINKGQWTLRLLLEANRLSQLLDVPV